MGAGGERLMAADSNVTIVMKGSLCVPRRHRKPLRRNEAIQTIRSVVKVEGGGVGRLKMYTLEPHAAADRHQGEKVAISNEILCHKSLLWPFARFRFCRISLNCIIPTGVRQKALRALRIMLTKSS